jgi:hypothetical protein
MYTLSTTVETFFIENKLDYTAYTHTANTATAINIYTYHLAKMSSKFIRTDLHRRTVGKIQTGLAVYNLRKSTEMVVPNSSQ